MLRRLDNDLWVCERPLRFLGLEVGARATVIRLGDGGLFVHSPVRLDEALRAEVDALGPVRFLVAPNRFHHLFIGDWMKAYPHAQSHAAPGLDEKRKDLAFDAPLRDEPPAAWGAEIDQIALRGAPVLNEVVFLHRATRTLILVDSAHNFTAPRPWLTRAAFTLAGGWGGFRTNVLDRVGARDRPALRAALDRVLRWDFDRVIVAHGEVLDGGGREALRRAYAWLG
jgi:uncharacterized protein DUF4336